MIHRSRQPLDVTDVLSRIRTELDAGPHEAPRFQRRLAVIRALQRSFREQPVGGRLTSLKRALYWFTASAFDRQAKVIEELIEFVDELGRENLRMNREFMLISSDAEAGHVPSVDPPEPIE